MEKSNYNENKMGVMPINKLLITMSLPMIISMLVQALYNVVDSIFVSQISENALTAVSLAFPLQNFMIAVGSGTGVGINALLSKSLGEKNFDEAKKCLMKAFELEPESTKVISNLGYLALAQGNKQEARNYFTTVLEFEPKDKIAAAELMKLEQEGE